MTTKAVKNIKITTGKDGRTRVVQTPGRMDVCKRIASRKKRRVVKPTPGRM